MKSSLECAKQIVGGATMRIGRSHASALELPLNSAVTQVSIGATICVSSWSRNVRPSRWQTSAIKMRRLHKEGLPPETEFDEQLEHIIPIVLGAALLDERNFELPDIEDLDDEDLVEACLARTVGAGRVSLDEARRRI